MRHFRKSGCANGISLAILLATGMLLLSPLPLHAAVSPRDSALGVDVLGDVYVAYLTSLGDLFLDVYAADPVPVISIDLGTGSQLKGMSVIGAGGVWVTYATSSGILILEKYLSTSTPVLSVNLGTGTQFQALSLDGSGNAFVAFTTFSGDLYLDKFQSSTTASLAVEIGKGNQFRDLSADSAGEAWLAFANGAGALMVQKFKTSTTPLLSINLGTGSLWGAMAIDSSGVDLAVISVSGDVTVERFSTSTTPDWSQDEGIGDNPIGGIAGDGSFNTFVAFGNGSLLAYRATTGVRYATSTGIGDHFAGLAVDSVGDGFVAFTTSTGVLMLDKFTGSTPALSVNLGTGSRLNAIAADNSGDVFVAFTTSAGDAVLDKFTTSTTPAISIDLGSGSRVDGMTISAIGYMHVAYTIPSGDLVLEKFTTGSAPFLAVDLGGGSRLAVRNPDGRGFVDDAGNAYVSYIDGSETVHLNKYNASGNKLPAGGGYSLTLDSSHTVAAATVDLQGGAYVAYNDSTGKLYLNKYNSGGGDQAGTGGYNVLVGTGATLAALKVDGAGNAYLPYINQSGRLLFNKLSASGGNQGGDSGYDSGPSDAVRLEALAVDRTGNAYFAFDDSLGRLILSELDPSGNPDYSIELDIDSSLAALAVEAGNAYCAYTDSSGNLYFDSFNPSGSALATDGGFSLSLGVGSRAAGLAVEDGIAYFAFIDSTGNLTFNKYTPAGSALSADHGYSLALGHGSLLNALSVESGWVYLAYTDGAGNLVFNKYSPSGSLQAASGGFTFAAGNGSQVDALWVDELGYSFPAYTDNAGTLHYAKWNPSGSSRAQDGGFSFAGSAILEALSPENGELYWTTAGHSGDLSFAKLNAGGGFAYGDNLGTGRFAGSSGISTSAAALAIALTPDSGTPQGGVPIGFALDIRNLSTTVTAAPVQLNFPLPNGTGMSWSILPAYSGPGTCSLAVNGAGTALVCSFGALAAGRSVSIHMSSHTSPSSCGQYTNTATLTAANTSPAYVSAAITVQCPNLTFTNVADAATVIAGNPIGYTLTAKQAGSLTATAVTISDPLPAGAGVNWSISPAYSGLGACSISGPAGGQVLNCPIGDMTNVTASVHVVSNTVTASCAAYPNTATLSSSDAPTMQASATITVQCPSFSLIKAHADNIPFTQGGFGTYNLFVTNASLSTATSGKVTVTDNLPSGLSLVQMFGNGWDCPGGNSCSRSDVLNPGAQYSDLQVSVKIDGNAPAQLTNQASVSGGGLLTAAASDPTTIQPFNCDVNGDHIANIVDAQTLIDEVLGLIAAVHDLNHDGRTDAADVRKVLNGALGSGCPY